MHFLSAVLLLTIQAFRTLSCFNFHVLPIKNFVLKAFLGRVHYPTPLQNTVVITWNYFLLKILFHKLYSKNFIPRVIPSEFCLHAIHPDWWPVSCQLHGLRPTFEQLRQTNRPKLLHESLARPLFSILYSVHSTLRQIEHYLAFVLILQRWLQAVFLAMASTVCNNLEHLKLTWRRNNRLNGNTTSVYTISKLNSW
jgi:hypothetical protein